MTGSGMGAVHGAVSSDVVRVRPAMAESPTRGASAILVVPVLAAFAAVALVPAPARAQTELANQLEAAKKKGVAFLLGRIVTDKVRLLLDEGKKVEDVAAEWKDVVIVVDPVTKRNTNSVKIKGKTYDDVFAILPPGWMRDDPTAPNGHALEGVGGSSALGTMALLAAGVNPNNEKKLELAIQSVLYTHTRQEWFDPKEEVGAVAKPKTKTKAGGKNDDVLQPGTDMVYALGIQCSALEAALRAYRNQPKGEMYSGLLRQLNRNGMLLERGHSENGGYHYHLKQGTWDLSCTQYGILGLWACARANVELSDKVWKHFNEFLLQIQNRDGGWSYMANQESCGTMTEAGIASIFLCLDLFHTRTRGASRPDIRPFSADPLLARTVESIQRGFENFGREYKPSQSGYYMYGAERIGVASGYKYFGEKDWFRMGAPILMRAQKGDGSWGAGNQAVLQTSWNLMFLVYGGAPVLMNKLAHGPKGDLQWWHNYPRDAANLATWYSRTFETLVNWQVIEVNTAKVEEDLGDAPILYISGQSALDFTDQQVDKLRLYVEDGGTLLFVAAGGQRTFVDSVIKLADRLYSKDRHPTWQFTGLPKTHPLFTMNVPQGAANPLTRIPVWHMHNGHRSFAFLVPEDINHIWHGNRHSSPATRIYFDLIANLRNYVTDKGFLPGKFRPRLTEGEPAAKGKIAAVKIAVVNYTSKGVVAIEARPGVGKGDPTPVKNDWAASPGTWRIFSPWFKHVAGGDLQVERGIPLTDPNLKSYDVLHLTGHHGFTLTPEEKTALQAYVEGGGSVLVEPTGGIGGDFYQSANEVLRSIWRDRIENVSSTHPIISGAGTAARDAGVAVFSRQVKLAMPDLRGTSDRLKIVNINGRAAVLISPLDLSVAVAGNNCWERVGFATPTARNLLANYLVYVKKNRGGAPVAAAN